MVASLTGRCDCQGASAINFNHSPNRRCWLPFAGRRGGTRSHSLFGRHWPFASVLSSEDQTPTSVPKGFVRFHERTCSCYCRRPVVRCFRPEFQIRLFPGERSRRRSFGILASCDRRIPREETGWAAARKKEKNSPVSCWRSFPVASRFNSRLGANCR